MWWKVYFWVYVVTNVIGAIGMLTIISKLSLGDWIGSFTNLTFLFGLYVFTFSKKEFYKWRKLFLGNLIAFLIFMVDYFIFSENLLGSILPALKSNLGIGKGEVIFSVLLSLPALYANFKLIGKNHK